ncbi:MAG TPA: UbiA-like polyprenyltransferase [Anaeromyxobacteraceae bacterium]|nr:UbiA-like polyprenyltransferase [Anaeromyxobacteraceae bacterium]
MSLAKILRMVKFEHSLFALPFAASAGVLVAREARADLLRLALVLVAVVAARTAAMAMNRIADRDLDKRNPRTRARELPSGQVSLFAAYGLLFASAGAFVLCALLISSLCGALALPVLAVLLGYSYAKRFTWAVHLWLGVAQALGPVGVAIALTGRVSFAAVVLGFGVGAWIAGFDILYALQDLSFDREEKVHSIPARFGVERSLLFARLAHLLAALAILAAGLIAGRGAFWLLGSALLAAVLGAEHLYAAPGGKLRLERIGAAFFQFNAFASVAFAACALADLALRT